MTTVSKVNSLLSSFAIVITMTAMSRLDLASSGDSSLPVSSASSSASSACQKDVNDFANQRTRNISKEKLLTKGLLDFYSSLGKGGRPVYNTSTATVVVLGLGLIQLELDEKDKMLMTSMWVKMHWRDEYLTWNPGDYDDVSKVRIHKNDIWIPDVMLINTAVPKFEIRNDLLVVEHDGNVTWVSHQIFYSSCAPDVRYFPFDHQRCHLMFSSWTHMSDELVLELDPRGLDIATFQEDFSESCRWDVTGVEAASSIPQGTSQFALSFEINLKRKTMFSSYFLTLPCVFLATLTLVVFWLPPERPDRTTLAMNIFASFLFLLLILVETAPPTSASVPKLAFYYCFNMVIIIVSIFLSSFVVNIYKTAADAKHPVPKWLNWLVLKGMSRIVCVRTTCHSSTARSPATPPPPPPSSALLPPTRRRTTDAQSNNSLRDDANTHPDTSPGSDHPGATGGVDLSCPGEDPASSAQQQQQQQGAASVRSALDRIEARLDDVVRCLETASVLSRQRQERDADRRRIVGEWKTVAAVLDRFFFHAYFVLIALSLFLLFPRPTEPEQDSSEPEQQ